ncbi:putative Hemerythrin-like domain-containing protein [Seiridium unicorne]|uniref:Hemerythrin-like domain-containing protein n=1 Tax=Seiridium unicorne TaxID=138068 RepID=A0ABR2UJK4_9PEZI
MSVITRHTACKLCRDRKVRCDGEQPACEKCRRTGEQCVYLAPSRSNKVDLQTTVETLQQRLNRAEEIIRKMGPPQGTRPYPSKNTSTDKENEEDKIIAAELASFTKVVFTAQSEIAGISLVLAEYLEWMRKAPKTFDHSSMLQKLESRAREVHDLARTRHYIAWKEMVAALETYRLGARLRELEGGVCRSLAELDRFFHAEYDVKCTLGDQRKSKRSESGPSSSNRSSSVASEDQLGKY